MRFSSLWVFSVRGCGPTPSKSNLVCGPALRVVWCFVMLCGVMCGSSLGGCDRLVVVVSGCVCLVAACTMKLNQYSILVIWGEGRCYTVGMWEGGEHSVCLAPCVNIFVILFFRTKFPSVFMIYHTVCYFIIGKLRG